MLSLLTQFAVDYTYNYPSVPTSGSSGGSGVAAFLFGFWIVWLIVVIITVVAMWKLYAKAGKPGWACLVPFYNTWVLAEIGGKPGWWMFLLFVPFVNIVVTLLIALGVARNFGKSDAFGIFGLWLFTVIGYMILGFGSAVYKSEAAPMAPAATMPPATPIQAS